MGRRRHFLCPQRLFDNNVAGQRVVRGRQDRLPQFLHSENFATVASPRSVSLRRGSQDQLERGSKDRVI